MFSKAPTGPIPKTLSRRPSNRKPKFQNLNHANLNPIGLVPAPDQPVTMTTGGDVEAIAGTSDVEVFDAFVYVCMCDLSEGG